MSFQKEELHNYYCQKFGSINIRALHNLVRMKANLTTNA